MTQEELIKKWLDNNLSEEELKAFKKLDASSAFMKIDEAAQKFAAPSFDENRLFEQIQQENILRGRLLKFTQNLLKEALSNIVFLPFSAGVMTEFENALYAENLPKDEYNKKWWELATNRFFNRNGCKNSEWVHFQ